VVGVRSLLRQLVAGASLAALLGRLMLWLRHGSASKLLVTGRDNAKALVGR
jgi:hypothetical protein